MRKAMPELPSPEDVMMVTTAFAVAALVGELAAQQPQEGYYGPDGYPVLASKCFGIADAMVDEWKKRLGKLEAEEPAS